MPIRRFRILFMSPRALTWHLYMISLSGIALIRAEHILRRYSSIASAEKMEWNTRSFLRLKHLNTFPFWLPICISPMIRSRYHLKSIIRRAIELQLTFSWADTSYISYKAYGVYSPFILPSRCWLPIAELQFLPQLLAFSRRRLACVSGVEVIEMPADDDAVISSLPFR